MIDLIEYLRETHLSHRRERGSRATGNDNSYPQYLFLFTSMPVVTEQRPIGPGKENPKVKAKPVYSTKVSNLSFQSELS